MNEDDVRESYLCENPAHFLLHVSVGHGTWWGHHFIDSVGASAKSFSRKGPIGDGECRQLWLTTRSHFHLLPFSEL